MYISFMCLKEQKIVTANNFLDRFFESSQCLKFAKKLDAFDAETHHASVIDFELEKLRDRRYCYDFF